MNKNVVELLSVTGIGIGAFLLGLGLGSKIESEPYNVENEENKEKESHFEPDRNRFVPSYEDRNAVYRNRWAVMGHDPLIGVVDTDGDDIKGSESLRLKEMADEKDEVLKMWTENNKKIVTPDGEEIEVVETEDGQMQVVEPYVISYEEYANDMQSFSKTSLLYFNEDNVLTNEEYEPFDDNDLEKVIGQDALYSFGYLSYDPQIVYVRNIRMNSDFEVIKIEESFTRDVLGKNEEMTEDYKVKEKDEE